MVGSRTSWTALLAVAAIAVSSSSSPASATPTWSEADEIIARQLEFEYTSGGLFARQSQGIGGDASMQPPGVPYPEKVPFANNDSLPYSPPFYPTPQVRGTGAWAEPVRRAREYIQQWSLEQRVQLVTGSGWQNGPCVGNIVNQTELGFPGLCLQDSPAGVRYADNVNVWPAGMTTAASFDGDLAYRRGVGMGKEFKAKGVNIALGPGMNMHYFAAGGRNWEMGGADPYLSGEAAYHNIKGMQSVGVQGCAKHFIGNEQEHFRNQYSHNIDERTLREIFLHPFMRSIQADVASIMPSYNFLNNSWSSQNSYLLNQVISKELNFQGYFVSDWGAQHSGVASANAGLTMTMPGDEICCSPNQNSSYWGGNLTMAVNNGSVAASRLEDMGVRILAGWYLLGQDAADYPQPNFDSFDQTAPINERVNVNRLFKPQKLLREIAAAGTVLVKNKHKKNGWPALPLKKQNGHVPNSMAILGSDAGPAYHGANFFDDRGGVDGTLGIGWGSGTAQFSYLISPYEALQRQAVEDGTTFAWSFDDYDLDQAMKISDERTGTDTAIVFGQSDSGEGYLTVDGNAGDRNNLTLWHQGDELVKAVASVQSNTIVVIHSPGQIDVEAWIDHPNVTAVVFAHMPGAESGNALRDVLYGDYVPAGRLPYTIAKNRTDYGVEITYVNRSGIDMPQINATQKLLFDYRYFDEKNITPRYEFGHGLSYTSFEYSDASGRALHGSEQKSYQQGKRHNGDDDKEDKNGDDDSSSSNNNDNDNQHHHHSNSTSPYDIRIYEDGSTDVLPSWLFNSIYEVSFKIHNKGTYSAHEAPQLYLSYPPSAGEPPKVLRKFDRVWIERHDTKCISWTLTRYDFSVWNSERRRWIIPETQDGEDGFKILIGSSSKNIHHTIDVEGIRTGG